jgi:hypothetical protein
MSAFWIALRWRASTISRLILAQGALYQVLRSIAKLAFPRTARRLIPLSNVGPILDVPPLDCL